MQESYPRVWMLTKLKYVGAKIKDLIDLYCLNICCFTVVYCSTAFIAHSVKDQAINLRQFRQLAWMMVILGVIYVEYSAALEIGALQTLHKRRDNRNLKIALKCITQPTIRLLFPYNLI